MSQKWAKTVPNWIKTTSCTSKYIFVFQNPYLILQIHDSQRNRHKRTTQVCSQESDNEDNHCCMWPLIVDFARDYNWTFIIYPPLFRPNYCAGDCSLGNMMPEKPYDHIMQQSGISPCCSPQQMGTLELLYLNKDDQVIQGTLPKMMVERCGCGNWSGLPYQALKPTSWL